MTYSLRPFKLRIVLPLMTVVGFPHGVLAAQEDAKSGPHALVGATLISSDGIPRPNTTIVFADGSITHIFETGTDQLPNDVTISNVRNAYVIPGLIDTHVHLATDPSGSDSLNSVRARLEAATRGGVTTVRDMGGDARQLAYLARSATLGEIIAPDIYYSAIVAGPEFMADPRVRASARDHEPGTAPWARSATATTDWTTLVRQAQDVGARGLKLYAAVTAPVVNDVARVAQSLGLAVWAHATVFPARPSEIVNAGVRVLSHAPYLVWEAVDELPDYTQRARAEFDQIAPNDPAIHRLIDAMAENNTILDPTLFVFAARNEPAFLWGKEVTRLAFERGVTITTGTDAIGNPGGPNLHREMELLSEAGLPNAAVLEAATINGAKALGLEARYGSIEVGKIADMVVLSANPLDNISNTKEIRFVVRRGALVDPN